MLKKARTTLLPVTTAKTYAVCGALPNKSKYQGVVMCKACTDFFQQAVARDGQAECAFDGNCVITKETRKSCAPCRLKKCEAVGLRRDRIKFKISLEARRKNSVVRQAKYKKTEKGKAVNKKYQQGPAGLATLKRYRTSAHGHQKIRFYRFQQLHPEGEEIHMPPLLNPRDPNAPVPKQLVDVVTGTKEKPISREKLFPGIYIGSGVDKRAMDHASEVSRSMDTNTVTELINGAKCETIESIFENGGCILLILASTELMEDAAAREIEGAMILAFGTSRLTNKIHTRFSQPPRPWRFRALCGALAIKQHFNDFFLYGPSGWSYRDDIRMLVFGEGRKLRAARLKSSIAEAGGRREQLVDTEHDPAAAPYAFEAGADDLLDGDEEEEDGEDTNDDD